jgi:hypothetical protein
MNNKTKVHKVRLMNSAKMPALGAYTGTRITPAEFVQQLTRIRMVSVFQREI